MKPKEDLNINQYLIYEMMHKRGNTYFIFGIITIIMFILLFTYLMLSRVYVTEEVISALIEEEQVKDFKMGFLSVSITDTFFDKIPKGDSKLYIEIRDITTNEVSYTYSNSQVGEGLFWTSNNINFPNKNETLYTKVFFSNSNYSIIDMKCYNFKFTVNGVNKEVGKEATSCKS